MKYALNYVQMLTRMPYTWQNNEDHEYFRGVCLTGGSWEDMSCSLYFNVTLQPSGLCFLSLIGTKRFLSKANISANRRLSLEFVIRQIQVASSKSWGKKFKAYKQWFNSSLCWVSSTCCFIRNKFRRKFTGCWLPIPFTSELIDCPQEVPSICYSNALKNCLPRKNKNKHSNTLGDNR